MQIKDLRNNQIVPFECGDVKLIALFSFFLHRAPTIESATAMVIDSERLQNNWTAFVNDTQIQYSEFIASNCNIKNYIEKNQLQDDADVNRRTKCFVCKTKTKDEAECNCFLRHIRNSIAHSNVYLLHAGNRKYIMFEDFNTTGNQSALILLSQSDLERLKKYIVR